MNKRQIKKIFKSYYRCLDKENFIKALEQNRLLYVEIFDKHANSNGEKRILEAGLDQYQLEKDATDILPYFQLNNPEEF